MARQLPLLASLLGLMLLAGLVAAVLSTRPAQGPVYSVADLRERLATQPAAWVSRIVLVRGMAEPCPWLGGGARLWGCADEKLILVPGPSDTAAEPLPLSQMPEGTTPTLLRGLPILRALLAQPHTVPIFTLSRFRVRLQSLAAQSCGGRSPCYAAVPLDVVPVASKEV